MSHRFRYTKKHQRIVTNRAFIKNLTYFFLVSFFIVSGISILWIANLKIPDLNSILNRKISQSTKIYDRTGEVLLYDLHQDIKRTIVPLNKISRHARNATIAIEDSEFYEHIGIKPRSIIRAVLVNIGALSYSQGGSTITQQVVKNSILTTDKTIARKLKEWVLSIKLEKVMDKDSILALYMNESPYGGSIYGIEEASRTFLGKSSDQLTIAESAYLASLPNAPTYFSPYGNHTDKLEERKNLILKRMLEENFISVEEYEQALVEKVEFKTQENVGILAPHFVMYVKEYLENQYGSNATRDMGLKVTTTLDYELQKKAEEIVKKYALSNKENYNAENAALVAINPSNGNILTMVGSRDYFDEEIDGNFNVTLAKRQPGSSFKPFVYATAFKKGYLPETVVFDVETEFSTECNPDGTPVVQGNESKCYKPQNYDEKFRGPISLRDALAQSINIPAIKALYLAGLKDSLQTAKDLGISSISDTDRYGLTLVLGGGEVSLLEMTSAYGVFANNGTRIPYNSILKIEDNSGNIIEEQNLTPKDVLPKNVALQISDILSDNEARTPAFGSRSLLYFQNRDVAVKTGTTNDYKDAWIVGYTPNISVGAWAGNNNNTPMEKKVAGFIIAPLWNAFMQEVLKTQPDDKFEKPEEINTDYYPPVLRGFWQGNQSYFIDSISGKLATQYTPEETKKEKVVKEVHSILYWIDKNNPLAGKNPNPENDSQFKLWEYSVNKWAAENMINNEDPSVIPILTDDIHKPENFPVVSISEPNQNISFNSDSKITIKTNLNYKYPIKKVDFYINESYIGSSLNYPFSVSFVPNDMENIKAVNTVKAVAVDSVYNRGESTSILNLNLR